MTARIQPTTSTAARTVPTSVPESDPDPPRCPYCDRPFRRAHLRDLHVGETHPERMTDEERTLFEERLDEESDELFVVHLKVVAALVLLFFAIAYLYAFVLSG